MAFKAGLEQWNLAVQTYESRDFHNSLAIFSDMGGTAKIHFNIGMIYSILGNYHLAISSFSAAIELDNYLAIAYFARALANIEVKDFKSAFEDFNDTLLYLRGNQSIDYLQLGLDFKLYSCEVLYNRGLCYFRLGSDAEGMNDCLAAIKEKKLPQHERISRALEDKGKNFDLYQLPEGCLFRPCESMVKNTKKIDYLGQAKVIAASQTTSVPSPSKSRQFPEPAPPSSAQGFGLAADPSRLLSRSGTISSVHYVPRTPTRTNSVQNPPALMSLKSPLRPGVMTRRNTDRPSPSNSLLVGRGDETFVEPPSPKSILRRPSTAPRTPPFSSSPEEDNYLNGSKPPSLTNSMSSLPSPSAYLYEPESSRPRAPVPRGKMKIRCHFNDTRSLMVDAAIRFEELQTKIQEKFSSEVPLKLKYKDEDEELVLITDQEDLDMALASLCVNSDGTMSHLDPGSGFDGRFELWCFA
ncbi:hypothetical protein DSO57_1016530 [Entomophthora muscae]|uniref:Uncharacterized protein n=2 Tax=Entomophthora muscae TaxID=34485 RepID=A0ACC2RJG4_9FUNG|nr:hypothetical protein DSO57_1016530 [Entomophthora muscae]